MRFSLRKGSAAFIAGSLFITQVLTNPMLVQTCFAQNTGFGLRASADIWTERSNQIARLKSPQADIFPTRAADNAFKPFFQSVNPFARVGETHIENNGGPTVLLLQDVHMNLEAQKNIGEVLLRTPKNSVIGVEAAVGPFDFSKFRSYPEPKILANIASVLLRENYISAISWMGLTAKGSLPTIVGVDDSSLYVKNVDAFKNTIAIKADRLSSIETALQKLAHEKADLFSAEEKALDALITNYEAGNVTLAAYIQSLEQSVSMDAFPSLKTLSAALQLEARLDQKQAEQERERLVRKISATDSAALQQLTALSISHGAGEMEATTFYSEFRSILNAHHISLAAYPHFSTYVEYAALADGIKQERIFKEIQDLTKAAIGKIARREQTKQLFKQGRTLFLAKKLVNFELTPEEWKEYQVGPGLRHSRTTASVPSGTNLEAFFDFYRYAEARNEKMVNNLLNARGNSNTIVLLAGGFHSAGIRALLRARGVSYAVLTPRISQDNLGNGSAYLGSFIRDRTPLEKLFYGEKLTVAAADTILGPSNPIAPGRRWLPAAAISLTAVLAAAYFATGANPNLELATLSAWIAGISGGVAILLSAQDRRAHLNINGTEIEAGAELSAPAYRTIKDVPGLGNVGWNTHRSFGTVIKGIALVVFGIAFIKLLTNVFEPFVKARDVIAVGHSPSFPMRTGFFRWGFLLTIGVAFLSMVTTTRAYFHRFAPEKSFGDLPVEKLNSMSDVELWNEIKKNGYIRIHERLPYLPHGGSRVEGRLWNYFLTHSVDELVPDFQKMDAWTVAQVLQNENIMNHEHRLAKPHKIMMALSHEQRSDVSDNMKLKYYRQLMDPTRVKKVVYIASEVRGIFHTGGIGVVADSFPRAMQGFGHDVSQILPYYEGVGIEEEISKNVAAGIWTKKELFQKINVPMDGHIVTATVVQIDRRDLPTLYLIQNPEYFGRYTMGKDKRGKLNPYFPANLPNSHASFTEREMLTLERFIFFAKACMMAMPVLNLNGNGEAPDVVHVNDWQTTLLAPWLLYLRATTPVEFQHDAEANPYMRGMNPATFSRLKTYFQKTQTVSTQHNAVYQGLFSESARYENTFDRLKDNSWELFKKTGLPWDPFFMQTDQKTGVTEEKQPFSLRLHGQFNFSLAMKSADASYTVSEAHATELAEGAYPELPRFYYSLTMDERFTGINNAPDVELRNPRNLKGIIAYGVTDVEEKKPLNKIALLEKVGLASGNKSDDEAKFVVGVVARAEKEKGFDLILEALPEVLQGHEHDTVVVVLASGNPEYERRMRELQASYPRNIKYIDKFLPELEPMITVGSDSLLVPSIFEPSGLTHYDAMIAGTLPIVAPSGGLNVVRDPSEGIEAAIGFMMRSKTSIELSKKIEEARQMFLNDKSSWNRMIDNAMNTDFSWPDSVDKVMDLYERAEFFARIQKNNKISIKSPRGKRPRPQLVLNFIFNLAQNLEQRYADPISGHDLYKNSFWGAPKYEAGFLFALLAGTFAGFAVVLPVTWMALAAATITTMVTFLLLHPIRAGPSKGSPSLLEYRSLGILFIFLPFLLIIGPLALVGLSYIPNDRTILRGSILAASLAIGAISTMPGHAWWNNHSPKPLTAAHASYGALDKYLTGTAVRELLAFRGMQFRYDESDFQYFATNPRIVGFDRKTQKIVLQPLFNFLDPIPPANSPAAERKVIVDRNMESILRLSPPINQQGQINREEYHRVINDAFEGKLDKVEKYRVIDKIASHPDRIFDATAVSAREHQISFVRLIERYERGEIAIFSLLGGAGSRVIQKSKKIKESITKAILSTIGIQIPAIGLGTGPKHPLFLTIFKHSMLVTVKAVALVFNTQLGVNDHNIMAAVQDDPHMTRAISEKVEILKSPGSGIPMQRVADKKTKKPGGVLWTNKNGKEIPDSDVNVREGNAITRPRGPGAFSVLIAAAVDGTLLKLHRDGRLYGLISNGEDLGAMPNEMAANFMEENNLPITFFLAERDVKYQFKINGRTYSGKIRGQKSVVPEQDLKPDSGVPNGEDYEFFVDGPNNFVIERPNKDPRGRFVPLLKKKGTNEIVTPTDEQVSLIEPDTGGALVIDEKGNFVIVDKFQYAGTDVADRIDNDRYYNTNQVQFKIADMLRFFGLMDANGSTERFEAMSPQMRLDTVLKATRDLPYSMEDIDSGAALLPVRILATVLKKMKGGFVVIDPFAEATPFNGYLGFKDWNDHILKATPIKRIFTHIVEALAKRGRFPAVRGEITVDNFIPTFTPIYAAAMDHVAHHLNGIDDRADYDWMASSVGTKEKPEPTPDTVLQLTRSGILNLYKKDVRRYSFLRENMNIHKGKEQQDRYVTWKVRQIFMRLFAMKKFKLVFEKYGIQTGVSKEDPYVRLLLYTRIDDELAAEVGGSIERLHLQGGSTDLDEEDLELGEYSPLESSLDVRPVHSVSFLRPSRTAPFVEELTVLIYGPIFATTFVFIQNSFVSFGITLAVLIFIAGFLAMIHTEVFLPNTDGTYARTAARPSDKIKIFGLLFSFAIPYLFILTVVSFYINVPPNLSFIESQRAMRSLPIAAIVFAGLPALLHLAYVRRVIPFFLHRFNIRLPFATIAAEPLTDRDQIKRMSSELTPEAQSLFVSLLLKSMPPMEQLGLEKMVEPKIESLTMMPINRVWNSDERIAERTDAAIAVYAVLYKAEIYRHVNHLARQISVGAKVDANIINRIASLTGTLNTLGRGVNSERDHALQAQLATLGALARAAEISQFDVNVVRGLLEKTTKEAPLAADGTVKPADVETNRNDYGIFSYPDLSGNADSKGAQTALAEIGQFVKAASLPGAERKFGYVIITLRSIEEKVAALNFLSERIPGAMFKEGDNIRFEIQARTNPQPFIADLKNKGLNKMFGYPIGSANFETNWDISGLSSEDLALFSLRLIGLESGELFNLDDHFRQAEKNIQLAEQGA